jgi:branched-chain amino acid transport system ATP-binding protein
MLEVRGLNAWYGQAHILFDVNLHVGRGEVVALMGRNGAGKSTTLKALMGLVDVAGRSSGSVRFMDRELAGQPPYVRARAGLGYVPEDRRIFTDLSVADNLETGRQPPRTWPDGAPAPAWTAADLYTLFPSLAQLRTRLAGRMSGGEQQMLTVARTLMGNPYLVLLDEPSEGVAPLVLREMAGMIATLRERGAAVLLSEQNLAFAQAVCGRAYVLEKGRIEYDGTMGELAARADAMLWR